ncbi:hypothetical protein K1719_013930 [Acacia pycnantha]|nr:hypothetical protein K1719_013930 [Acacia pycnantha]
MASSLEELLANEGFKKSRRMTRSISSLQSDAVTAQPPRRSFHNRQRRPSISGERILTERAKSDVSRYQIRSELLNSDAAKNVRPRDNLDKREDEGLKNINDEKLCSSTEVSTKVYLKSSKNMPRFEITEVREKEDNIIKDVYSNETSDTPRGKEKNSSELPVMDAKVDKRHDSDLDANMPGHFRGNGKKSVKEHRNSYSRSTSKSFDKSYQKHHEKVAYNLALDEVAVRAIVSILNGHIKRFMKDEDFRTTLRHNCFSLLSFIEPEDENSSEAKVITSLEQGIGTVERAVEESLPSQELKRASQQLSIVATLSLNDLKHGFTCGMPNYKLSASAHLYLSALYKIQRKDKASAKHLLQVFCDSPFQARRLLLPELWEDLFSPLFFHLKAWYTEEVDSLANRPSRARKQNLLEKVYEEHLDSGTYMFAVYCKNWLTEGVEPPSIPSISIPSISVSGSSLGHLSELSSPVDSFSPQPTVSKRLYHSVFGSLNEPGIDDHEDGEEDNDKDTCIRGCYGSAAIEQTSTHESEIVKFTDQDVKEDSTKNVPLVSLHPKGISTTGKKEKGERNHCDGIGNNHMPDIEEKEVIFGKPIKKSSSLEGLSFPTIPQEFLCPLTGKLLEEPVTIETGQTFEHAALKSWFQKGHRTCPVTGVTLDFVAMPLTNIVLKRLIHNWKSEQLSDLLASAPPISKNSRESKLKDKDEIITSKLESLFTLLNEEDKVTCAEHLISSRVLEFLLRRFELGNLEEKTCVAALLPNFIGADSCCMYQIARDINKRFLLDLLRHKEVTPRTNAILLLTKLLALKRKKDVTSFLNHLKGEDISTTMRVLLMHLKNSPPHHKPLIAVLLLHFDHLISLQDESQNYRSYRDQALNSISEALHASLNEEQVRENCCRALSILAGHFSSTGNLLTKRSILKEVGYMINSSEVDDSSDHEEEDLLWDGAISFEKEEERSKEWLVNLLESMIGGGESPFLKSISECLDSRHPDLVSMCLITVAWLSSSLSTQYNAGLHLITFLAVIYEIKQVLENEELELKILASMCLFNFSKISECRALLSSMAEDIDGPLHELLDVTWTAKQLHAIFSVVDL